MLLTIFGVSFGIAFGVFLGRFISMTTPPWSNRHEMLVDALGLLILAFGLGAVANRLYEILGPA